MCLLSNYWRLILKIQTNRAEVIKELWNRGYIAKLLLRKHQHPIYNKIREVLKSDDPMMTSYVIDCSRQFGKSFIMFLIAVEECLRTANRTIVFCGPLKSQVNEIINGNTFRVLFLTAPADLIPIHKDSALIFKNGSRIRLAGTDNKNYLNIRGGAAHTIFLDEAAFMSDLSDGVLPTVTPMTKTTGGKIIFASTPPESLDHDYMDILRDHDESGLISTFTIKDDTTLTKAQYDKIVNDCKGENTTMFKREHLCMRVVESSKQVVSEMTAEKEAELLLSAADFEKYMAEQITFMKYWKKYIILDTGLRDMSACIFAHYNYRLRKVVIEDQVWLNGDEYRTDKLAKLIKDTRDKIWPHEDWKNDIRYIADSNNPIVNRDLSSLYDLPFNPTTKGSLEEMVQKVKNWVFDNRILFAPSAKETVQCVHYAHWNKTKDSFGKSKRFGHYDLLASVIYLIRNVDEYTNPVPVTHGINPFTQFIHPSELKKQNNMQTMFKR
jgi:hypothetical protein